VHKTSGQVQSPKSSFKTNKVPAISKSQKKKRRNVLLGKVSYKLQNARFRGYHITAILFLFPFYRSLKALKRN